MRKMILLGSRNHDEAAMAWSGLYEALSVIDEDDIFARFLQSEMEAWIPTPNWQLVEVGDEAALAPNDREGLNYPAKRFVHDLQAVIGAKHSMTRRQWTSLLEAVVRLAAVAHVAWLCEVHARTWECLSSALAGKGPNSEAEVREALYPQRFEFLSYGDRALPGIKDRASSFLRARLGINAVLWTLSSLGSETKPLSSAASIWRACEAIRANASAIAGTELGAIVVEVSERETRTLACKKGIGSNILEFARHVLGQRQAANPVLRGYDQGFILRKRGTSNSSPWVVGLGPVSVLALVHCALSGTTGPRSVRRLSQHLAGYGVVVDHNEIATNDLGHQLRMLGLVLDSPDAESGMLLVPPFPASQEEIA
ncbi:hypothetical protein WBP07_01495 [Novosphingobium sp. BL-8A]|uniref:hypothetical protein n=1 Tax=Novosphingobium sp. BL-8A TaxID=3127639 RepID=UPI003757356D